MTTSLPDQDHQSLEVFATSFDLARMQCLTELPGVMRQRIKSQKNAIPTWLELNPDFLSFLHDRSTSERPPTKIALSLSNLLETPLQELEHVIPVIQARELYNEIYQDGVCGKPAFRQFQDSALMIWAPAEIDILNKTVTCFQKYALSPGARSTLKLLVPHEPYPGCDSATLILDLWWSPLLSDKWKCLLRNIEFFRQPSRCIFTGNLGPLHHIKSLALFTLSAEPIPPKWSITSWRPTLVEEKSCPAIIVDYAEEDFLKVHKALNCSTITGLLRWDGPRRSSGTTSAHKRSVFIGFFDPTVASDLDIRLNVSILRTREALAGSLIGSRSLYANQASMLVDFRFPQTLLKCVDLCDEVVLVSPKLAAIMTSKPAATWAKRLTSIATEDPAAAIDKIRFRQSRQGGRPWAKPQILRAPRQKSSAADDLCILIAVYNLVSSDLDITLTALLRRIAEILGSSLQRGDNIDSRKPLHWLESRRDDGS